MKIELIGIAVLSWSISWAQSPEIRVMKSFQEDNYFVSFPPISKEKTRSILGDQFEEDSLKDVKASIKYFSLKREKMDLDTALDLSFEETVWIIKSLRDRGFIKDMTIFFMFGPNALGIYGDKIVKIKNHPLACGGLFSKNRLYILSNSNAFMVYSWPWSVGLLDVKYSLGIIARASK